MKKCIYFLASLLIFGSSLRAQSEYNYSCGTTKVLNELFKEYPEGKQVLNQLEIFTQEFLSHPNHGARSDAQYIIPVVVHVIHPADDPLLNYEQIDDGIQRINDDFNAQNSDLEFVVDEFSDLIGDIGIEFRLATKDPEGNCTYGVNRFSSDLSKMVSTAGDNVSTVMNLASWDPKKYLNIWVVKEFIQLGAGGGETLAFAYPPGSHPIMDGIFCRYDYFGTMLGEDEGLHTLGHEMGHVFNLSHTWGPGELGLEENCSLDDGVADTPSTIGQFNCPLTIEEQESTACVEGVLENVQNIMNYSNCKHMFTIGQADRAVAAVNSLAGNRWYLWQESNLVATGTDNATISANPYAECAPIPQFVADKDIACAGQTVQFTNSSYNYRNEEITYAWSFDGAIPSQSTDENPVVEYLTPGVYSVSLTACNGDLCRDVEAENYVTVLSETMLSTETEFSQGFESESFPTMGSEVWSIGNDYSEQHWERTDVSSIEGTSSMRIKSQEYGNLRNSHQFTTPVLTGTDILEGSDLDLCFKIAYAKRLPYVGDFDEDYSIVSPDYSIHHDRLFIDVKGCGSNDEFKVLKPVFTTRPGYTTDFSHGDNEYFVGTSFQDSLWTTDKIYFNSFYPSVEEWEWRCVELQSVAQNVTGEFDNGVIIRFNFQGTGEGETFYDVYDGIFNAGTTITASTIGGNWLYIDDIRITDASALSTRSTVSSTVKDLAVSPNPSYKNEGWVSFYSERDESIEISITNFLGISFGKVSLDLLAGQHRFKLSDLFDLPNKSGSYVVAVSGSDSRMSEVVVFR